MRRLTPIELLDFTEGQTRTCKPRCCDLWLLSTNADPNVRSLLESCLSADETERAGRFHFDEDRLRFIVARGGLRRILSSYCSTSAHEIEFQTGSHGKPALRRPFANIEFNVSHSGDCVLIGLTSGIPCGVDIECAKANANVDEFAIATRFFCSREVEWLGTTKKGFSRLWVTKEAIAKAVGRGLSIPLSDLDVLEIVTGEASSITLQIPDTDPFTLWVNELPAVSDCVAAAATVGEECGIRLITDPVE